MTNQQIAEQNARRAREVEENAWRDKNTTELKNKCHKCGTENKIVDTYDIHGNPNGWVSYCWCGQKTSGGYLYKR